MELYRVFDWDQIAQGSTPNGPLFAPRLLQGSARHDIPSRDGILYCSTSPVSAISEYLQFFKGLAVTNDDFVRADGRLRSLVHFVLDDKIALIDLRDSKVLAARHIQPHHTITRDYELTRRLSAALYDEGAKGFLWTSSLEAQWTNVSLFHSRVVKHLQVVEKVSPLHIRLPDVIEAAKKMVVSLDH